MDASVCRTDYCRIEFSPKICPEYGEPRIRKRSLVTRDRFRLRGRFLFTLTLRTRVWFLQGFLFPNTLHSVWPNLYTSQLRRTRTQNQLIDSKTLGCFSHPSFLSVSQTFQTICRRFRPELLKRRSSNPRPTPVSRRQIDFGGIVFGLFLFSK